MKHLTLFACCLLLASVAVGQKAKLSRTNMSVLNARIQQSATLSASFKQSADIVLAAADDDDCNPPACIGIIDPWTCECTPDIRDPWEDEKIAAKLKAFKSLETAALKGEGGKMINWETVKLAQKKFPGNSLKAVVNRLNLYAQMAK